jgi:uncharacterized membrane protein YoaK (UPF0700 family)
MKEIIVPILIIVASFALIGWLSRFYQRRFNLQRNFLSVRVTKKSQAIAIIIAFIFGTAYFIETSFLERFHVILLVIAIIALAYSFRKPQDTEEK